MEPPSISHRFVFFFLSRHYRKNDTDRIDGRSVWSVILIDCVLSLTSHNLIKSDKKTTAGNHLNSPPCARLKAKTANHQTKNT